MKQSKNDNKTSSHARNLSEVFLLIALVISVCLGLTLYFYYNINSNIEKELLFSKDVHRLKAYFQPLNINSQIKGYLEINQLTEGLEISGKVEGLPKGSEHEFVILEYADISSLSSNGRSQTQKQFLKHYNPDRSAIHSCDQASSGHAGDLGVVITNEEGVAFLSLTKKNIPITALNGRVVVISSTNEKCNIEKEFENADSILGYGLLSTFKPLNFQSSEYSEELFNPESLDRIPIIQNNLNTVQESRNVYQKQIPVEEFTPIKNNMVDAEETEKITAEKPETPLIEENPKKENLKSFETGKVEDLKKESPTSSTSQDDYQQKLSNILDSLMKQEKDNSFKQKTESSNKMKTNPILDSAKEDNSQDNSQVSSGDFKNFFLSNQDNSSPSFNNDDSVIDSNDYSPINFLEKNQKLNKGMKIRKAIKNIAFSPNLLQTRTEKQVTTLG
jgi:Cu/Zn superoxide dismutase